MPYILFRNYINIRVQCISFQGPSKSACVVSHTLSFFPTLSIAAALIRGGFLKEEESKGSLNMRESHDLSEFAFHCAVN